MKILLLLLSLCYCIHSSAQTRNFNHFILEHNLPAQFLMQDSKGYIWIGSNGAFRFDGLTTKRFVHDAKNTNSLINNTVRNIVEDKDKTIWIATQHGISHYYPTKDSFKNYTALDVDAKQFNSATDNFIFCDDNNNIWLGNQTGIYLFNKSKQSFQHFSLQQYQQQAKQRGSFITSIIQDKSNKNYLWLSSYEGIAHFNKSNGHADYYYFDSSKTLTTKIFQDSHYNVWICTWGKGIGLFNPSTKQFSLHSFEPDTHYGISNVVADIKEQIINKDSSNYYISSSKGFGFFTTGLHKQNQTSFFDSFYINNPTDKRTIGVQPHEILIDKQGTVWVGTNNDISYILHNNQVFKNYSKNLGNVYCIDEEKDATTSHYLIAAWYMNGLFKYDNTLKNLSKLSILDKYSKTNDSKQINAILNDTINHVTWIATFDGLFEWNRKTNAVNTFRHDNNNKFSLPSSRVVAIAKDNYNRLWTALYGRGIAVVDLNNDKCVQLPDSLNNIIASSYTPVLFIDKNKNIWIAVGDRLVYVNATDFSFKTYNINGGEINCIEQDKQGKIWIGCTQGLRMLNRQKSFDVYTMQDGLPNDNISCIGNDMIGNLWVCTAEGISNFNTSKKTFTNYFTDDGLISNGDYNCITCNNKGEIMIGGNDFITVFNPLLLSSNKTPPPVYITSLRILNRNGTDTLLYYPSDTLRLTYNQNYFNVNFTALNLINASANKYAYQLEGLDKNWIRTYTRNAANYSNLSPGTYIFKVKAANNNDVWNNKGASLTIIIEPPFWQTWWFISLCVVAVCAIIYSIYRYRLNHALRLEILRTRISTDLHDDIGSTLSSISILSDMVMHGEANGSSKEMLYEIKENSVNLMEKMDDIVWSINPRNDSLENLLLRIKRFSAQLFEAKNIEYDIDITSNLQSFKIPMEIRQHLYLMIKEVINNIIKHSECTQANISIQRTHDHLKIYIADNGKGFTSSEKIHGNGLINLKERAKIINASFTVQTLQKDYGTQIEIELKIK